MGDLGRMCWCWMVVAVIANAVEGLLGDGEGKPG